MRTTLTLTLALFIAACGDDPSVTHDVDATTTTATDTTAADSDDGDTTTTDATTTDATTVADTTDATTTPDTTVTDTTVTDTTTDTTTTTSGDVCVPEDGADDVAPDVIDPGCDFARDPADGTFDDHTILGFESAECLLAYAGPSLHDPVGVKFVLLDFSSSSSQVRYFDNGFYQLHDEWYWFRLLNNHAIPGLVDALATPVASTFESIAAVYDAVSQMDTLPLDLRFLAGGSNRLYSPHFYSLGGFDSSGITRFFGMGTVVHYEPNSQRRSPGEIWGFELEYVEPASVASITHYFERLTATLPAEVADHLVWVSRSPQQDGVANAIKNGSGPYKDRVLTYNDLVVDGEVVTYNAGITAGVINVLGDTWSEADIKPNQIAIIPRVPDDIPPTRAIVSAIPQTPFAHVNLLAKSRGTPNVYIGGILQWGQLGIWAFQSTPVVLEVNGDEASGSVRWQEISSAQYNVYQSRLTIPQRHINQVADVPSAPYTVSLTEGHTADMADLVPLIGGKCAGFFSFLDVPGMETPPMPMCITVRAYIEHVAEFIPVWRQMVVHPDFTSNANARFLLLEGEENFDEANAGNAAIMAWKNDFIATHQSGPLGQVLAAGGVHAMIRDKAMNPTTLALLRQVLTERYGFLAATQGLRFRSSSTAEDVIGFNGAGLHDSNTGFLVPSVARDPDDRKKSIEWAIKKTWASYWNYNAFEERKNGNIDHFEGTMAVVVHPRFDDPYELANAVATHYYTAYGEVPKQRFIVNIQAGPTAITNPGGSTARVEIDEVDQVGDEAPVIRRLQRSGLVDSCTLLLSDEQILRMYTLSKTHTQIWLDAENARRPVAERNKTIVLDMEIKHMAAGWPELANGDQEPDRILWRQSRVLDSAPVVKADPDPWLGQSFPLTNFMPQDLRTVAERVVADVCSSEYFDVRVYKIFVGQGVADSFPFTSTPYIYKVFLGFKKDAPGFDWPSVGYWLSRGSLTTATAVPGQGTHLALTATSANTLGADALDIDAAGQWTVRRGSASISGACTESQQVPYSSPAEYLRSLLPPE